MMSLAWEVSQLDVETVLKAHGVVITKDYLHECHNAIDGEAVEEAALFYNSMANQSASALDEIENQLLELYFISGDKKFSMHVDIDDDDEYDDLDYDDDLEGDESDLDDDLDGDDYDDLDNGDFTELPEENDDEE